jgi:carbon-monoxide dehydrogenase medium subunit
MYPFIYLRPERLTDAVAMLRQHPEAKALSGGMTLVPTLKQRLRAPSHLVDLTRLAELQGIRASGDVLHIGAATRHAAIAESPVVRALLPALAELASLIGDQQVRNRGTVGGSVANCDPAADHPAGVLGLDATVVTDRRRIAADDFFVAMFETALAPDEIVVGFEYPRPRRAAYAKHRHPASGYAVAGVFIAETANTIRVAVTGAGPCAFRWTRAEQRLAAHGLTPAAIDGLALDPAGLNDDLSASAAYRASLVATLARRALAALQRAADIDHGI